MNTNSEEVIYPNIDQQNSSETIQNNTDIKVNSEINLLELIKIFSKAYFNSLSNRKREQVHDVSFSIQFGLPSVWKMIGISVSGFILMGAYSRIRKR